MPYALRTFGFTDMMDCRTRVRGLFDDASPATVEEAAEPMIAQLIGQMGLSIATVVRPQVGLMLDDTASKHNVFYVPVAAGSPHIVAQDEFVAPYGIASVVGFGGIVATGDMSATILFSKVLISAEAADLFSVIALNLEIAILPFMTRLLFATSR